MLWCLAWLMGCGSNATPTDVSVVPCVDDGNWLYDDDPRVRCCAGLHPINPYLFPGQPQVTGLPAGCTEDPQAPPEGLVCTTCGDGECLGDENYCNCGSDCPAP